jgi:hypothetical protein
MHWIHTAQDKVQWRVSENTKDYAAWHSESYVCRVRVSIFNAFRTNQQIFIESDRKVIPLEVTQNIRFLNPQR